MYRNCRKAFTFSLRLYSTAPTEKPSLKLVAELRKRTEVSITKAREALSATGNDVSAALEWLQKDLITSGAKKAAKLGGRPTREGLISVSVLSRGGESHIAGVRAAMIELNCETDFVGRNELFGRLAADIAHTAAYISDHTGSATAFNRAFPLDVLKDAPLLSQLNPTAPPTGTVGSSIRDMISKVGENISLRRALTVVENPPSPNSDVALRLGSYVHDFKIGSLALLALKSRGISSSLTSNAFRERLEFLERALARQILGFETTSVNSSADQTSLYNQPFMMFSREMDSPPVGEVLRNWSDKEGLLKESSDGGVAVLNFAKWRVGETLEE